MRKLAIALVTALAVISAACGGGEDDNGKAQTVAPEETTTTTAAPVESADTGDLKAKLLTVADMPTGYSEKPPEPEDEEEDTSDFCQKLQALEKDHKAAEEAEVTFQKGEASLFGGAEVVESLGRFESKERAKQAFDAFAAGMQECKTFEQTDADGSTFKGSFTALSFPKVGDDTFAVHLKASGGSEGVTIDLGGDFVVVRKSRLMLAVATFSFGATAIPASELEQIVRKAVSKL